MDESFAALAVVGLVRWAVAVRGQPRFGYRSVRQHHIGDALEALETRGVFTEWRLVFGHLPTHSVADGMHSAIVKAVKPR